MIPIAGDQVTNDIAMALRTPTKNAEEIKIKYAKAMSKHADAATMIDVPSVAGRPSRQISEKALADVVGARYEELFNIVQNELRRSGFEDLIGAGIVITGGASMVNGLLDLADEVFKIPVRQGLPQHVRGLTNALQTPVYATGIGLLLYGLEAARDGINLGGEYQPIQSGQKLWNRMAGWFKGNF